MILHALHESLCLLLLEELAEEMWGDPMMTAVSIAKFVRQPASSWGAVVDENFES